MKWIKRNVFFVLGLLAGVGLTGYCGWLFYENSKQVSTVQVGLQSDLGQLTNLLKAAIGPTDHNIQVATEDQRQVSELLDGFRRAIPAAPVPPREDEQGFRTYLGQTVQELGTAAANAGVELPTNFAFGFTDQLTKLNYPTENIRPWMEQLGEIKAICGILYEAKIRSVVSFQRVRVSPSDDGVGSDYFGAAMATNAPEVVTPYKICFRGLSQDVAEVLCGLARSGSFMRVKTIAVRHDTEGNVVPSAAIAEATPGEAGFFAARPMWGQTAPRRPAERMAGGADGLVAGPMFVSYEGGGRGGGGRGGGGRGGGGSGGANGSGGGGGSQPGTQPTPPAAAPGAPAGPGAPGARPPARPGATAPGSRGRAGAPATVLSEGLLRVTLSVEVVKLSGGGH